jgi:hypothetical protein
MIDVPPEVLLAVQQVVNGYSFYYDREDFDSLAEIFTEDASLDTVPTLKVEGYPLPAYGRAAVIDALRQRGEYFDVLRRRHAAMTHFVSEYTGEWLRSHAYLIVIMTAVGASPEMVQVGEYEDEMRLGTDGRWRIASRRVHKDRRGPAIDSVVR